MAKAKSGRDCRLCSHVCESQQPAQACKGQGLGTEWWWCPKWLRWVLWRVPAQAKPRIITTENWYGEKNKLWNYHVLLIPCLFTSNIPHLWALCTLITALYVLAVQDKKFWFRVFRQMMLSVSLHRINTKTVLNVCGDRFLQTSQIREKSTLRNKAF